MLVYSGHALSYKHDVKQSETKSSYLHSYQICEGSQVFKKSS